MICGNCHTTATTATTVRACYTGAVTPCWWVISDNATWVDDETGESDSWPIERPCGAHTIHTDRGWSCEAGHSHVTIAARHAEGWEYAEDDQEAKNLLGAGVEPRDLIDGRSYQLTGGPSSLSSRRAT